MNDFSHILNIERAVTGFSEFSRADNLFRDTGLSIINPDMTSTTEISSEDVGEPHTVLSCACGEPATIEDKCVNCVNGKSVKKTAADASFSWSNGWDADREWNHQFPPQGKTSKNSILKMSPGTYVPDEKSKWGENWNNFTMIISKDSGIASLIHRASLTASLIEEQNSIDPSSGNKYSNKPGNERRAFCITWLILCSAFGSGSKILTLNPMSKKRAADPLPMTPPPITANFNLVSGFSFRAVNEVDVWLNLIIRELVVGS